MLYHSADFAVFFAALFGAYLVVPQRARSVLLLAASYVFYADFQATHLAILLGVTVTAYTGALAVEPHTSSGAKRWALAISVALILGALGFFKYAGFVLDTLGILANAPAGIPDVSDGATWRPVLPIGISFYTLQAVSYLVDVYKGRVEAERRPLRVALYLAFFPQILAGPIERAGSLMTQFARLTRPTSGDVFIGAKVAAWGLFCKLVVADKLGLLIDPHFAEPGAYPGLSVLVCVYLYSFQIFFDFYGYTNVSIGLARMLGVRLSINFDNPYAARSIRDFWHRWHITLTTWFRDYVYIPLGGRASSRWKWTWNVAVVFLISGLWHGAAWNFVIWGGLHGLYYASGTFTGAWRSRLTDTLRLTALPRLKRAIQVLATFHLVTFAWLFFRLSTVGEVTDVLARIAAVGSPGWADWGEVLEKTSALLYVLILVGTLPVQWSGYAWRASTTKPTGWRDTSRELAFVNALVLGLLLLGDVGARAYIYFRF